ncbi:hypothetical protein GCM10018962_76570 [Dactylosporangium matsuzakiense]|uniref:Uncharacterized protein n=2 Tax=Dactylosporangium TaxID=35753 RepID=A0A9W6NQK6_9ACTN|nr:hypothetical protein GCM10017581_073860 [Dactylosporangium matsuzakiense]
MARALVALAGVVTAALAVPGAAYASGWQLTDGFESNPSATWSCWNSVVDPNFVNGCNIGFASPNPHSGTRTSWIQANSGWSDVGRTVSLTPFTAGRTLTCGARLWGRTLTFNAQLHGQLEVIDVATWTYVSVQPFTFTKANDYLIWRPVTTAAWVPPHKDVFVRIGLIGENNNELDALEVDDLTVSCSYY